MQNGSKKWPESKWKDLLSLALTALDTTPANNKDFILGGSTALALNLDHRISYNIDIFLNSANLIKQLSPSTNQTTKNICWNENTKVSNFDFDGNFLKLKTKNNGEINFILASDALDDAFLNFNFNENIFRIERPAETIAKKLRFRSSKIKTQDIFDIAATFIKSSNELDLVSNSILLEEAHYKRTQFVIKLKKDQFQEQIIEEVNPTKFGLSFINDATDIAIEALDRMQNKHLLDCKLLK